MINGLKAIPTHIALKKGAQFRKLGFVAIRGLIKSSLSSALKQDAIASASYLEKHAPETTAYQSAKQSRSTVVLLKFQAALLPLLRTLTGYQLVPSDSWYIYYEETDEIGLHVDPEESDITVLTSVLGEVGPLHLHQN